MNRSRKDVVMMIAIGVLVLFATYNFVFRPQGTALSAARDELGQVEQSISDAKVTLQSSPDTTAPPAAASPANAIPADPAMSTLLRQLEAIAVETGVIQASISPTVLGANPSGPGGSMQISITASGSHDAAQAYLKGLRELDRLFVIEQVGIAVGVDAAATEQLQISGRVFTQQGLAIPVAVTPTSVP